MKPHILVITSTVRKGRTGRDVADWYLAEARKITSEAEFELLDIAELDLPIFSEATPPLYAEGNYTEVQQALADRASKADGYVIVTGEYNHSIPGSLKNALDYLTPREWRRKPVAYVGYGARGAFLAISHLADVMTYFEAMSIEASVNISAVWEAFDEQGEPRPGYVRGDVSDQLAELLWWARVLKAGRAAPNKS